VQKNKWIRKYVFQKNIKIGKLEEFKNIEVARQQTGVDNNIAFDFSLAENVVWELDDKHYVSFTATFNSIENVVRFVDIKHSHDKNGCYLPAGVELLMNKRGSLSQTYIDHTGRSFLASNEV